MAWCLARPASAMPSTTCCRWRTCGCTATCIAATTTPSADAGSWPTRWGTRARGSRRASAPTSCWKWRARSASADAVEAGADDEVDDLLVGVLAACLEEAHHRVAGARVQGVEDRHRRQLRVE